MKTTQLILSSALALAFAHASSAQTVIRISSAQAWRPVLHTAIGNILQPGYTAGYVGTDITKTAAAIFTGTTIGTNLPVIIKTSFPGSTAAVQIVAQNLTPASTWLVNASLNGPIITGTYESNQTADVAVTDSFQGATLFTSPSLTDQIIGVEPYVWVKNLSAPSTLTNITAGLAQDLLGGGLPLSQFTNSVSDQNTYVYAVGRDENSGVRLIAFAESGYGIFTPPIQFQPTLTSGTITSVSTTPAAAILGTSYPIGHSGYSSSSNVIAALNAPGSLTAPIYDTTSGSVASGSATLVANGGVFLSYLAVSDAATVNSGSNNLSYNGVPYSVAAVQQGQYSFWSYGHFEYRNSLSGNALSVTTQLKTRIHNYDATVLVSSLAVGRTVDGGAVTSGNPY